MEVPTWLASVWMEVLTFVIGAVALTLAVTALTRTAPTFTVEPLPEGQYSIWHQGPGSVVIRRAFVRDAAGVHPLGEQVEVSDADEWPLATPDNPSFRGVEIEPHQRYFLFLNVNRELVIHYRAKGLLGHFSRSTIRIIEGP